MTDPADRDARTYEGWLSIFRTTTDFEADLVRDRLDSEGIAAVVLTQRDHAFNLTVGDLAAVHVMVRPEDEAAARAVVDAPPVSDADLTAAALAADLMAPDAHSMDDEAALDSGIESIRLSGFGDAADGSAADDLSGDDLAAGRPGGA